MLVKPQRRLLWNESIFHVPLPPPYHGAEAPFLRNTELQFYKLVRYFDFEVMCSYRNGVPFDESSMVHFSVILILQRMQ